MTASLAIESGHAPRGSLAAFLNYWGRGLPACAGFGLSLVYCLGLLIVRRHRRVLSRDVARAMSRLCCTPLGIRVVVHNAERLEAARPCVFVANHQSFLDYPILGRVLPAHTIIVGKAEMGRIPVVGALFRRAGHVLIRRGGGAATREALHDIARTIREHGVSVWMFPEGTRRTTTESALLPFRAGAFRLAVDANVAIVPVVVDELKPHTDITRRRFRPRVVNVRVLEPVAVDDAAGDPVERAMTRTFDVMRDSLAVGSSRG